MEIKFYKEEKIFFIETENTTYAIGIEDKGYLGHIYYGKKIKDTNIKYLLRSHQYPMTPMVNLREKNMFLEAFPMEYAEYGMGDYREPCLCIRNKEGYRASESFYVSYEIIEGKPKLKGLPATFGNKNNCKTLCITCVDKVLQMELKHFYTIFKGLDVIVRHTEIKNNSDKEFYIEKALSGSIDLDDEDFEVLTMHGSWARENYIQRIPISYGRQNVGSHSGKSSHQEHPFIALLSKGTTQDYGNVYAMHFIYSGNFQAQAEKSQFDNVRLSMGIHPQNFCWKLNAKENFVTPEVVLTYSDCGLGKMTRTLHDLYRNHLIRSKYKNSKRPILINNWEATYFDFNEKKLLDIAKDAKELGIEMLVMDDGWFGNRFNDESSLGDWFVNENKLKGGLKTLVDNIKKIGLKFGIWFEPEMISPNSDLYRKYPDWAIQIPNRDITQARAQYVLDFSRKEVRDYIYNLIYNILKSADISYVKWDMNRQLTTMGSYKLDSDRQGELYHRYILGVYEMQERLLNDFPNLLLENCSGGGARFDPGMLYYSPQIWCSDNTDAIERLLIQEGASLIYPISCIGAHVSACPNHIVGRTTPFETRGIVALSGTFGYELDITKLTNEEKQIIKKQVKDYHKYNDLIREGDYYRLASYSENNCYDSWMIVSKDKSKAIVFYVQVLAKPNYRAKKLKLKGLDINKSYKIGEEYYNGDVLMNCGILIPMNKDFSSNILILQ